METNMIFAIQLFFLTYFVTNCSANLGDCKKIDTDDPEAIEVAKIGLDYWHKKNRRWLYFKTINSAEQQIVNGVINFDVKFVAFAPLKIFYPDYFCVTQAYKAFRGPAITKTIDCQHETPTPDVVEA